MNREFLMLAHTFDPDKHYVGGWFVSEKLDGQRCFWDGGITRGIPKDQVPWANTAKDYRYREEQICTGLWSRYGNIIHAPSDWLDSLPSVPLDGELYMGLEYRQDLRSIISRLEPQDWSKVFFHVFDVVDLGQIFQSGRINNPNFKIWIDIAEVRRFLQDKNVNRIVFPNFQTRLKWMQESLAGYDIKIVTQTRLNLRDNLAKEELDVLLNQVSEAGGEGLMLRCPNSVWEPIRSKKLLKVKKILDAEAVVIGYTTGREGKLLGMLGALVVSWNNISFELSGFTDDERVLSDSDWAARNPETWCPDYIISKHFPRGSTVTFKYRGLTKDGIPQEARYWRKHENY